eukprot:TRINITY_DN21652_c0_g1_i1.p1 TRINITY_DN21652_c0_g1~~TRINITY_DN21652_c0_g1_i1.p1  ORF type:complete len:169 (+),score=37.37 TRINITY_DN21652_c0_g1_i1:136-642(+)
MAVTLAYQPLSCTSLIAGSVAPPRSENVSQIGVNRHAIGGRFSLRRHSTLGRSHQVPRRSSVVVNAAESDTPDVEKVLKDTLKTVTEAWDKTEDKLAIAGIGFAAVIVLWASAGLVGAIDKLPIIPGLFELVGIVFTGWFVYRYLLFKPDREELLKLIDEAKSKITGK